MKKGMLKSKDKEYDPIKADNQIACFAIGLVVVTGVAVLIAGIAVLFLLK